MRIELNYKEYTSMLCSKRPKCNTCSWKLLPISYCAMFCRKDLIFRASRIAPSIFHL